MAQVVPPPLKPQVLENFDVIKQCKCGSDNYWLPVGHRDIASSYRCLFCSPPPSPAVVQQKITVMSGEIVPPFAYTFNVSKRVCKRCASRTVTMSQNGYHCNGCSLPITDAEGSTFWEFDEQDKEALFKPDYRKHTKKDIELIVSKKKLPVIQTHNGRLLPVDVEGFMDCGYRHTMQPRPTDKDIQNAGRMLARVRLSEVRGDKKRVSFAEIRRIVGGKFDEHSCTDGGLIIAASNRGIPVHQCESHITTGEINVSRGWWSTMVRSQKRFSWSD